jgi:hypothetical protein
LQGLAGITLKPLIGVLFLWAHVMSLRWGSMASSTSEEPLMNRLISRLPHLSDRFVFRSTLLLWVVAVLLG